MPHPKEAKLVDSLPADIANHLRAAFATKREYTPKKSEHIQAALAAAGFVDNSRDYALPSALTPTQRTVAEIFAHRAESTFGYSIPMEPADRRRWLGIDPPSALEEPFDKKGVPVWFVLNKAIGEDDDLERAGAILNKMPKERALRVFDMLMGEAYGIDGSMIHHHGNLRLLDNLKAEGKKWAIARADAWAKNKEPIGNELKLAIFVALVRAKVPIEPRWDNLLPAGFCTNLEMLRECARALPEDRRTKAILASFGDGLPNTHIDAGFALLCDYDSEPLARAILEQSKKTDIPPKKRVLEDMAKLAKKRPFVARALEVFKKGAPKPVILHVLRVSHPKKLTDLSSVQQKQLRIAGKGWDGKDLPAKARMSGSNEETSFRGTLEVRVFGDEKKKHIYDALLYAGDSASIFKAGTTKAIAHMTQGSVEHSDQALRDALQAACS